MQYPKKSDKVYVEAIDQELCVYDWERQKMHTLNPTAALVWQQCDGQTAPAQMAARLEQELQAPQAEQLVWLSLDRLEKAQLLEAKATRPALGKPLTRRELLKAAGLSLALLPLVKSIVLPTPVEAQCSPNCILSGLLGESEFTTCEEACRAEMPPGVTLCSVGETPVVEDILCECRYYISPEAEITCPDNNGEPGVLGWR